MQYIDSKHVSSLNYRRFCTWKQEYIFIVNLLFDKTDILNVMTMVFIQKKYA